MHHRSQPAGRPESDTFRPSYSFTDVRYRLRYTHETHNGIGKRTLRTEIMIKKCLIIYNQPGPDALDVLDQVNFIRETLVKIGHEVSQRGITDNFFSEIAVIAGERYDYVFNL